MMRARSSGSRHLAMTLAGVALLAACTSGGDQRSDSAVDPPDASEQDVAGDDWIQSGGPVGLLRSAFLGDAAFAIALAEGWFEEAGIEVITVDSATPADAFGSIAAGDIDVSYFAPNGALFAAAAADVPIRVVAAASVLDQDGCDYLSIVGTEDDARRIASGDPAALRGLRIAGSFRSLTAERFLEAALGAWGTDPSEGLVEVVTAQNAELTVLLRSDQIDLAVVYEPHATLLKDAAGAVPILGAPEVIPDELTSLFLFSRRLLEDRELGARVLAVYLRGEAAYRQGPTDRNVEIVSAQTGIEPDLLRQMCWATLDADGRRYEAAVEAAQRTAVARGDIVEIVPANRLWDHSFLNRARALYDGAAS